jgi:Transposase DDE domain
LWGAWIRIVDGIKQIAASISAELQQRLPHQRKTQRGKLALLIATMLDVRSANLMDLAAGLPLDADRTDMRYQWISRLLSNPRVVSDAIMEPFAREVLEQAAAAGQPVVVILDQSKLSDRHQVLMLALRYGERALPLAWRVATTRGAIGFDTQKALLETVAPWLPAGATVMLMGDRFYGTADLISWCQDRNWDYRLRLKGNLTVFEGPDKTTTGAYATDKVFYLEDVELTSKRARTHIGILHDPGHKEPWIIAMSARPGYLRTLEYSQRWGIEPMFSDFKSRGFGVEDTQIRYADRLDRLILVMALALYSAVSTGLWDAVNHPTPSEKKASPISPRKWRAAEPPGSPAGSVASSSSCKRACHCLNYGLKP